MDNVDANQLARKCVAAQMAFYMPIAGFIAGIMILAVLDFASSPAGIWVHWPMMGLGVAVVIHAAFVCLLVPASLRSDREDARKQHSKVLYPIGGSELCDNHLLPHHRLDHFSASGRCRP